MSKSYSKKQVMKTKKYEPSEDSDSDHVKTSEESYNDNVKTSEESDSDNVKTSEESSSDDIKSKQYDASEESSSEESSSDNIKSKQYDANEESSSDNIKIKKKVSKSKKCESSEDTDDSSEIVIKISKTKKKVTKSKKKETKEESSEDTSVSEKQKLVDRAKKNLDLYDGDDFRNIIFENINDDYAYGKMGTFTVMIMKKNGYINATKLCNFANKRFAHWLENKGSNELVEEVDLQCNRNSGLNKPIKKSTIKNSPSVIMINTGTKITHGTYLHSDLIIHVACWCNSKFAIQVSHIVKEFFAREAVKEMKKLINEKDNLLGEKDNRIDNLENIIENLRKENEAALIKLNNKSKSILKDTGKIINQNTNLSKQNSHLSKQNVCIAKQNGNLTTMLDNLDNKLDIVCNDRVVNNVDGSANMLVVFKNNDVPNKKKKIETYDYCAKRIMKRNYNQTKREHEKEHPKAQVLVKHVQIPNVKILWVNIKQKLKNNIDCRSGNVNLKKKYTEKQFLKDIKNICNERFDRNNI